MDLEVLSYLVRNMEEASAKLGSAVEKNQVREMLNVKKIILKLSERFTEELNGSK